VNLYNAVPKIWALQAGSKTQNGEFIYIYTYITIRKVENQVRLKLNGTHQLPVYDDNMNILGDKMDNVQKNRKTQNFDTRLV
jgi:hypothetical protein